MVFAGRRRGGYGRAGPARERRAYPDRVFEKLHLPPVPVSATELTIEAHDRLDRLREGGRRPADFTDIRSSKIADLERLLTSAAAGDSRSFDDGSREHVRPQDVPEDAPWNLNVARWDEVGLYHGAPLARLLLVGKGVLLAAPGLISAAVCLRVGFGTAASPKMPYGGAVAVSLVFCGFAVIAGLLAVWQALILLGWLMTAGGRLARPFFVGRGPTVREEETVGERFVEAAAAVWALTVLPAVISAWLLGVTAWSGVRVGVGLAAAAGIVCGGYRAALELDMHARRREILRDVIRRADALLGDAGGDGAVTPEAEPAPATADLPPHVAALARLAGRLAKADGRVTPSEVAAAEELVGELGLSPDGRDAFVAEFGRGKRGGDEAADLAAVRRGFETGGGRHTPKDVFFMLLVLARADGHVGPGEAALLERAGPVLLGGDFDPRPLRDVIETNNAAGPYAVLGLTPPCTKEEARKAYRKKAAELHPDRLRHQDIPDEMRRFAEERYRAVTEAYQTIEADLG